MLRSFAKAGAVALPRRAVAAAAVNGGVGSRSGCLLQGSRAFSHSVQEASLKVTFVDVAVSTSRAWRCIALCCILLWCLVHCRHACPINLMRVQRGDVLYPIREPLLSALPLRVLSTALPCSQQLDTHVR